MSAQVHFQSHVTYSVRRDTYQESTKCLRNQTARRNEKGLDNAPLSPSGAFSPIELLGLVSALRSWTLRALTNIESAKARREKPALMQSLLACSENWPSSPVRECPHQRLSCCAVPRWNCWEESSRFPQIGSLVLWAHIGRAIGHSCATPTMT